MIKTKTNEIAKVVSVKTANRECTAYKPFQMAMYGVGFKGKYTATVTTVKAKLVKTGEEIEAELFDTPAKKDALGQNVPGIEYSKNLKAGDTVNVTIERIVTARIRGKLDTSVEVAE